METRALILGRKFDPSKVPMPPLSQQKLMYLPRIVLPIVPGVFAAYSSLLAKYGILSILTAFEANNFGDPVTWIIIILIPFTALAQIWLLNFAFQHFLQLEVVPIYQAASLIMCIVVGGVSLNEFSKYDQGQLITFSLGCLVCVLGMMILLHFDSIVAEKIQS